MKFLKQPRHWLQLVVLAVTLAVGLQFFLYVRQASGTGGMTIQRPAGVEGFLPIGALMGWKQFLTTGKWDAVHPAAMVIFGWAVLLSFLLRKAFCSWFCPVGTVSEWAWRAGGCLFGRHIVLPVWLDVPLRAVKYAILGFFLWVILRMPSRDIASFLGGSYYALSDVKMLHFFTRMTVVTAVTVAVLASLSVVIKNFWCRYLCPYGALLGVVAILSPSKIRRDASSCIDCGRCDAVCPARLAVSRKKAIVNAECTGCMDCVEACPKRGTLGLVSQGFGRSFWSTGKVALFIGLFFLIVVYGAGLSGHWRSGVGDAEFRERLRSIDAPGNTHPSIEFR